MCRVIADVGANHLGNRDLIIAYAKACKARDVDILKFQGWKASKLIDGKGHTLEDRTYYLNYEINYKDVVRICVDNDIQPLITAFDLDNIGKIADAMRQSKEMIVKIASSDMLSWGLIDKALDLFDKVLISTGMHSTEEIFQLGSYLRTIGKQDKVTLLHCVSKYPAHISSVHMARVEYLKSMGIKWGYSDHTTGIEAAVMAMAMGAYYVEKHITFSKQFPTRDASMSAYLEDFSKICYWRDNFDVIRGKLQVKELTPNCHKTREQYIGKWGDNK